jgi:formylglycine-generating enzyme required for sulfatase activity
MPSLLDYREAISNPGFFSDPNLKDGKPVLNKKGNPFSSAGKFAITFKYTDKDGKLHAIRCFTTLIDGIEQQYKSVQNFITQSNSEYFVNVDYQNNGIYMRIQGEPYPICVMEWVDGLTLDDYIKQNIKQLPSLNLSTKFVQMIADLQPLGYAHGDLQHGNIMVENHNLKLVDYDGMYVPEYDGQMLQSKELGHRNYQHPKRNPSHYNADLDNFSAIVIFLSLVALERDPSLFSDDVECLLIGEHDFKNPYRSEKLQALANLGYKASVQHFQQICQMEMEDIPSLIDFIQADAQLYSAYDDIVKDLNVSTESIDVASYQSNLAIKHTTSQHDKTINWMPISAKKTKLLRLEKIPSFKMSKYPITNAQFREFVDENGYNIEKWWTEAGWAQKNKDGWIEPYYWTDNKWNNDAQPVVGVSWFEANAYCLWLSDKIGNTITLPTEEQWQFAAEGERGFLYPWGNQWNPSFCNSITDQTTPVTQYEGIGDSPFSIVDMLGNVWEWCLMESEYKPLRGGSWIDNFCNIQNTLNLQPHLRTDNYGFRVCWIE